METKKVLFKEGVIDFDNDGTPFLIASRCKNCGKVFFPSREFCTECYHSEMETIALKEGNIHVYTVVNPKLVKIPGIYVDAIVVCQNKEDHAQCQGCEYDGSMTGDFRVPLESLETIPMSTKKIIGRRAAMELKPDKVVNLGIGIPEYISMVANEEGISDYMTLTVESGSVGGVPQAKPRFGGSVNVDAILDQTYQFDFYDGGGIDLAFLGLAQADQDGNINVSKFGPSIAGCGGFINITQNAKKVFFCGTLTADGIKTHIENGKLIIDQEGRVKKMIREVEQITFSGEYARLIHKERVFYGIKRSCYCQWMSYSSWYVWQESERNIQY